MGCSKEQDAKYFDWASIFGPENKLLNTFKDLAKELHVVWMITKHQFIQLR